MDLSSYFGRARVDFYHGKQTVDVPLRDKKTGSAKGGETISLLDLCKSATPPCNLNPLLFNGHLHTTWTVIKDQSVPIHYHRHVFQSTDQMYPGQFAVDFVSHEPVEQRPEDKHLQPRTGHFTDEEWVAFEKGSDDDTPMLVALHGLSGGSHELYLRHALAPLTGIPGREGELQGEQRWEACVVNARGCARSSITSSVLFNARATWDVKQTVKWLRKTFPNRPLFAAGFSLGGNILTNYLAEEGEQCELNAAVVCSNPWNLDIGASALVRTFVGREVYSKAMATNLKKLFERHKEQIMKNPVVDAEQVRKAKYLHEFDRAVQCPSWGYPTEGAYYRDASSTDPLLAVRIPMLALHAADDPVAAAEALPWEEVKLNPYAVMCVTAMGGHLGWFEWSGERWYVKPLAAFLRRMAEDVDLSALRSGRPSKVVDAHSSKLPAVFAPVRRRLCVPAIAADPE